MARSITPRELKARLAAARREVIMRHLTLDDLKDFEKEVNAPRSSAKKRKAGKKNLEKARARLAELVRLGKQSKDQPE